MGNLQGKCEWELFFGGIYALTRTIGIMHCLCHGDYYGDYYHCFRSVPSIIITVSGRSRGHYLCCVHLRTWNQRPRR